MAEFFLAHPNIIHPHISDTWWLLPYASVPTVYPMCWLLLKDQVWFRCCSNPSVLFASRSSSVFLVAFSLFWDSLQGLLLLGFQDAVASDILATLFSALLSFHSMVHISFWPNSLKSGLTDWNTLERQFLTQFQTFLQ